MDRKKTLDWITWIVNMLVALPFMGLLSCFVVWLVQAVLDVCSLYINLPHKIWIVVVLGIFLTVIWGQYQYDILIRKNVRLTSKRGWKSLCILAGVVILASLLLVGIPAYLRSREYAKYNEALRRHRESMDKQAELTESPDRPQEEKRTEE